MKKPSLPSDDLPPTQVTLLDELLLQQLAEAIGKLFYRACGRITRTLLSNCHWYFKASTSPLVMVIFCYDIESYLHIANALPHIVKKLKLFSNNSKIRISPPPNKGLPWELEVDQIGDDGSV